MIAMVLISRKKIVNREHSEIKTTAIICPFTVCNQNSIPKKNLKMQHNNIHCTCKPTYKKINVNTKISSPVRTTTTSVPSLLKEVHLYAVPCSADHYIVRTINHVGK